MADNECFSAGSITGAVIGTFVATLILLGIIWLVYNKMKKRKMQKSGLQDLVIVEEGRGNKGMTTFDNPGFVDESMDPKKSQHQMVNDSKMNGAKKQMSSEDASKKMPWGPFRFLFKSRTALDDSVVEEPQTYNVSLRGQDFSGLGFNICGNMKDGIFVKDVMQRGPAAESKHILPGDQITSLTISFDHMVLEDAVTILSYASPYEVSLEMLRHPEKSLSHKGLFVSSSTHPSGSGQTNTLERVCHPFFKSQSIDDLRKVGKEHLDQQIIRGKKQGNGMHGKNSSTTMVLSNEARSSSGHQKAPQPPNVNLSMAGKIIQEAHQKQMSVDEVDSPRGPIVPEIKVSAKMSKPEIIPRAKSKVTNLKKEAPEGIKDVKIVQAISPTIKMSADFEKMVEEHSFTKKVSLDYDIYPQPTFTQSPVQVEDVQIEMPSKLQEQMPSMVFMGDQDKLKTSHVEIEMTAPELSPVKKPRSKDKKVKEPKKEIAEPVSGEKSKFGKFGFNLPDISLNFGKGSNKTEEKDKQKDKETKEEQIMVEEIHEVKIIETKEKMEKPEKEKKDKSSKGKEKEIKEKEMSPKAKSEAAAGESVVSESEQEQMEKKPIEKSSSSGFGFSLKFPSFDKPILKRKESSGSSSGENSKDGEMVVDKDPGAKTRSESPSKAPKTQKSMKEKEKKTKEGSSRPTSPVAKDSEAHSSIMIETNEMMNNTEQDSADLAGEKSPGKKGGFHMPHLGIKLPKFGHSKQTYSFESSDGTTKDSKHQSEIPKTIEETMSSSVKVELNTDSPDSSKSIKLPGGDEEEIIYPTMGSRPSSPLGVSYGLYPREIESEIKERSRSPTPARDPAGSKDNMTKSQEDFTDGKVEKSGESKPGLVSKGLKGLRDLKDKVAGKRSHDIQNQQHLSSSDDETGGGGEEQGKAAKEKAKLDKKAAKESREKAAAEAKAEKERLKAEKKKAKKAELKAKKQAATSGHSSDSSSSSSDESDVEDKEKNIKKSKSKEKSPKIKKDKEKKSVKKVPTPVETIEIESEMIQVSESQSQELTQKKDQPPVAPRKFKDSKKESKEGKENKDKKYREKKAKSKKGGEASGSSSSSSSSSESDDEGKPKKPKRSAKRKAPVPPIDDEKGMTITTSAEVITAPRDLSTPKLWSSFGDLGSSKPKSKNKLDMDRAMSVDMASQNSEQMSPTSKIPVGSPLEDLSADLPDPKVTMPHFHRQQQISQQPGAANQTVGSFLSASSSSETLKSAPTTVHVFPKESLTVVTHSHCEEIHNVSSTHTPMAQTQQINISSSTMMSSPSLVLSVADNKKESVEKDASQVTVSTFSSQSHSAPTTKTGFSTVTISSSSSAGEEMDRKEVEKVAQEAVDDIIAQVNRNGSSVMEKVDKHSSGSVKVESGSIDMEPVKSVSVTNIMGEPHHFSLQGDKIKACETKTAASLLRSDSKSRLMQTVHDANTIKVNPISPLRKDSSMSSSSSSVDSSPEVKSDQKLPSFPKESKESRKVTQPMKEQTIEISAKELDGIMMSHADFLQKQASMGGGGEGGGSTSVNIIAPDSLEPVKDASFDNWVYVEQTKAANVLTCANSNSDPEPSTSSSSNDDEDIPYNRNGALSPSTYKMETEYKYETSEMKVTSSPLSHGESGSPTTTKVYATTMTLPQKTITQITLGEPVMDSQGRIVSKITLESPDSTNEDLPTLKPTK